jgi:uncharacterized protein
VRNNELRRTPISIPFAPRWLKSSSTTFVNNGKRKGHSYTTRLSAKIKSKETADANAVTRVSALNVPSVVSPSSVWNIQKKLLFTCKANSAPEPIAKPSNTGGTSRLPNTGTSMPAAVMAATEIEPMARCKTAAINQASKYVLRPGRIAFVHTEVYESYGGMGLGGRLARAALDDARARGLVVMPFCPFIAAYIERHLDEYGDLVAPEMLTGDRDHDPESSTR